MTRSQNSPPPSARIGPVTLENLDEELLVNPTAVLATIGPGGQPQLTAVWYIVEDGRICISITESTRKAKNLRANNRCSLLIFHPSTPNYYVEIRGTASLRTDHAYEFADRLGRRHNTDMRSFDSTNARRLRVAIDTSKVVVTDVRD